MPHPMHDPMLAQVGQAVPAGELVDQPSVHEGHHGVAVVRDIFSDARWTPVEPVRARDWHDNGAGAAILSSETTFD
jgi:hypothetical protein